MKYIPGVIPRQLLKNVKWAPKELEDSPRPEDHEDYTVGTGDPVDDWHEAELVTSRVADGPDKFGPAITGLHAPVLDLDFPVQAVQSTTPGHYHLYLDRTLSWDQYRKLLAVLADVGLIERGYAQASTARGYTAVRAPWVHKPKEG